MNDREVQTALLSLGYAVAVDGVIGPKTKTATQAFQRWRGLAVIAAVGVLAYAPIRENQSDLKLAMVEMAKTVGSLGEKFVSIRELDGRSSRTRSELDRVNSDLKSLETVAVPRGEHTERWRGFDASVLGLQRQIDEQNKKFGDTFSLRDALQQMQREIDRLRAERHVPPLPG